MVFSSSVLVAFSTHSIHVYSALYSMCVTLHTVFHLYLTDDVFVTHWPLNITFILFYCWLTKLLWLIRVIYIYYMSCVSGVHTVCVHGTLSCHRFHLWQSVKKLTIGWLYFSTELLNLFDFSFFLKVHLLMI